MDPEPDISSISSLTLNPSPSLIKESDRTAFRSLKTKKEKLAFALQLLSKHNDVSTTNTMRPCNDSRLEVSARSFVAELVELCREGGIKDDFERMVIQDTGNIEKCGSGFGHSPLTRLMCCNGSTCKRVASLHCGNCRLFSYCSQHCQRDGWRQHRLDCKKSPQV